MPRPRRNRSSAPAFPELPPNIQIGLKCLVSDNASTIAQMLDMTSSSSSSSSKENDDDDDGILNLCEKCALVMKQQQLSPALFLARFFDVSMLVNHVTLLGKSAKGSVPVLAERVANEWTKGNLPSPAKKETGSKEGRCNLDDIGSSNSNANNNKGDDISRNKLVKKTRETNTNKKESPSTSTSTKKRASKSQIESNETQTRKKNKKK